MSIGISRLIGMAQRSTEETFRKNGSVRSMLYVHTTGGEVIAIDFKSDQGRKEDVLKTKIVRLVHMLRINGKFSGATITAEAWFSTAKTEDGKLPKNLIRPIDDPKRKEMLLAAAWDQDGKSEVSMSQIDRVGDAVEIGKWEAMPGKAEIWLDRAFIDAEKIMGGGK